MSNPLIEQKKWTGGDFTVNRLREALTLKERALVPGMSKYSEAYRYDKGGKVPGSGLGSSASAASIMVPYKESNERLDFFALQERKREFSMFKLGPSTQCLNPNGGPTLLTSGLGASGSGLSGLSPQATHDKILYSKLGFELESAKTLGIGARRAGPQGTRLPIVPARPATMKKSKSALSLTNGYTGQFVLQSVMCAPTQADLVNQRKAAAGMKGGNESGAESSGIESALKGDAKRHPRQLEANRNMWAQGGAAEYYYKYEEANGRTEMDRPKCCPPIDECLVEKREDGLPKAELDWKNPACDGMTLMVRAASSGMVQ